MSLGEVSLAEFRDRESFEYFEVVNLQNLQELLVNQAKIDVSPPSLSFANATVEVKELIVEDKQNFLARLKVIDDATSTVVLRSEDGVIYGTVRLANTTYTLLGINKTMGILYQRGHRISGKCGSDDEDKEPGKPGETHPGPTGIEKTCRTNVFRILVLYTSDGAAAAGNTRILANTSVDLLNDMLGNSEAVLRAELAGFANLFELNESGNIVNDRNRLNTGDLSNRVRDLKERFGADHAVVMTDGVYNGTLGIAPGFGPTALNTAIVQSENAVEDFVFPHEVGHMLGGRHQNNDFEVCNVSQNLNDFLTNDTTPGDNHGFVFSRCRNLGRDFAAVTVMISAADLDGPFVYNDLRWNVDYLPEFSNLGDADINKSPGNITPGIDGEADNIRTFDLNSGAITAIENQCSFSNDLNGWPGLTLTAGQQLNLTATSAGCEGTAVVHRWSVNINGSSFTQVATGTNASITVPFSAGSGDVFSVRLESVCEDFDGNPDNDPNDVFIRSGFVGCLFCRPNGGSNNPEDNAELAKFLTEPTAYPNPVSNGEILNIRLPEAKEPWIVEVFSIEGKLIERLESSNYLQLTTQDYPNQVFIRVIGEKIFTQKIIIQ